MTASPRPDENRMLQLPLSRRQEEVVALAALGQDVAEIAQALRISVPGVRQHIYAIADKLENPRLLTPLRLVRQWAIARAFARQRRVPPALQEKPDAR